MNRARRPYQRRKRRGWRGGRCRGIDAAHGGLEGLVQVVFGVSDIIIELACHRMPKIMDDILALDISSLTPIEAINKLNELQQRAKSEL